MKAPLGSMKLISNEILVTKNIYPTNISIENMKIFPISINNKTFVMILEYLDINDRMKLMLTKKNLSEWRQYVNMQKDQENLSTNDASDIPIIYYQYDTATLLHETFHKYDKKRSRNIKSTKSSKNPSVEIVDIESIVPLNDNVSLLGFNSYINIMLNNRSLLYTFIGGVSLLIIVSVVTIIHVYFHFTVSKTVMILLVLLALGGFAIIIVNIRMFILLHR